MAKGGSLIVVGSGIKSVGHLTIEAKGWIEQSDIVVYCVADPATEVWIKKHTRSHLDLYALYGNDKKRIDTYNDMTQVMLDCVRSGRDTCAVFYGHPGVFVLPTHKAIAILRAEGYPAVMLPGISALDCLWADIGVDPSTVGSQAFEATDMLLRERVIQPDGHVVIWQIGCIGDLGFNFAGYDCKNVDVLCEYLERYYPPSHEVTHYQGAQYPMCPPAIEKMPLRDLRSAIVTGISTLYIPPFARLTTSRTMGIRLGLLKPTEEETRARRATLASVAQSAAAVAPVAPPVAAPAAVPVPVKAEALRTALTQLRVPPQASRPSASPSAMGQAAMARERTLEAIRSRRIGPLAQYLYTPQASGLADYIAEMMADPRVLAAFLADPKQSAAARADLTPAQRRALASMRSGAIRMAMKDFHGPAGVAAPPGAAAETGPLPSAVAG